MNTPHLLFTAFASLVLVEPIAAASFDCAKAQSNVEKQICADPVVSELDEHLGRYYRAAQAALERGGECLRADQRRWLRETRNQCADTDCLRDVYGKRLRELEGFQPGATEIKSIDLPDGPALAWIFAPGEDELALPTGTSKPFTAEGTYKDEPLHGPTLRTADGELYVLVPLMLFEGDSRGVLEGLAASGETIRARGKLLEQAPDPADYADPADAPEGAFDNRECVFVYRTGV